jgi:hypothetical protein
MATIVAYAHKYSAGAAIGLFGNANAIAIDDDATMAANSHSYLPTQAAVIAYVAAHSGGGSGLTWNFSSGSFSPVASNGYAVDTSGGTATGTLAASPTDKDYVQFADRKRAFGTHSLTIARNGKNIDGAASDYVLQSNGDGVGLLYNAADGNWLVVMRTLG